MNLTRAQHLLRWATIWPQQTWAEKWGCNALSGEGEAELGLYVTQCGQGQGLLRTKWHHDLSSSLGTIGLDMGRWCCAPFVGKGRERVIRDLGSI